MAGGGVVAGGVAPVTGVVVGAEAPAVPMLPGLDGWPATPSGPAGVCGLVMLGCGAEAAAAALPPVEGDGATFGAGLAARLVTGGSRSGQTQPRVTMDATKHTHRATRRKHDAANTKPWVVFNATRVCRP